MSSSTVPVSLSHVNSLIESNSVASKHYIEYNGFLSNHFPHVAIALYLLKDGSTHFQGFLEHYKKRLEATDGPAFKDQGDKTESESIQDLKGQRRGYYQILDHYRSLLEGKFGGDLDEFLRAVLPNLVLGGFGSAFHPIIHVGYGYAIKNVEVVLEGITYFHHSFLEFKFDVDTLPDLKTLGKGSNSLLGVIDELRGDDVLYDAMRKDKAKYGFGGFQSGMHAFLNAGNNDLLKYVHKIRIPDDIQTPEDILKWVIDQAIFVYYAATTASDFFLIHGVTATWALSQFFHLLTQENQMETLRSVLCGYLAVYLVQMKPELKVGPSSGELELADSMSWDDIRAKAFDLKIEDTDEHSLKLVQVCYMRSQESSEDSPNQRIYKLASLCAIDNPVEFESAEPIHQ